MSALPSGIVTFVFTDVEGSTRRWDAHGAVMKEAMARHDGIVRSSIESNGGAVFTTAGDEFCSAFSTPHQAVAAAVDIQIQLGTEEWGEVAPFRVRMALHTGTADERDGDYFGTTLNRCARLLSIGHGGQILVSAITAQLLLTDLPSGVGITDLGAHELKDLEESEHVFQITHTNLGSEFPGLRSNSPLQDAADLLSEGRQAHTSRRWRDAYLALSTADELVDLGSEDLRSLGDSAYWLGHRREAVAAKEKAYGVFMREGNTQAAALMALDLALLYKYSLAAAVSKAWASRAESLVGDAIGTEAHGYLLRWKSVYAFETEGEPDKALALADQVMAAGVELGNRSIEALGLMDKGRFLVTMGHVAEGMVLVDESMVAAVSGEIDPDATGRNYCNMLAVCDAVADYERAAEWSDAAQEWCEQHSDSAYPGICRITRAELKWLRGDWDAATNDLHRAVDELDGWTPIIGAAVYQIGEIELRAGNLSEAEGHFKSAHEHGFVPLPGMAQLRLAEGKPKEAKQLLLDALIDNPQPLDRAKYLPPLIDSEVALDNVSEARTFLAEFEEIAEVCDSTAMRAEARDRRAVLAVLDEDQRLAIQELQAAIKGWTRLRMPYEAAQSRLRLGRVFYDAGNETAALMETDSANSTLERLGVAHSSEPRP
jgi:class 3 adenylate cyclase